MGKTNLAPGFRFHPTDVELVRYYLRRKVMGKKFKTNAIAEIDIYKFEPPDLPDKSCLRTGDLKWYFFCPKEKKYPTGASGRAKRSTECGYWKTSGQDRDVSYNNEVVGKIRTLIFHLGKTPRGERTDWVMHEYRLEDKALAQNNVPQDSYALCVLYKKNGAGPRHGDQYGAPFNEEEWSSSDDEEEDTDNLVAIPYARNTDPGPSNKTSLVATASYSHAQPDCFTGVISESCISDVPPITTTMIPPLTSDVVTYTPMPSFPLLEPSQAPVYEDNDVSSLLNLFFVNNDECLSLEGFHNQNEEVRHEPGLPVVEEDPVCSGDDDLSGMLDLDYELFIDVEDLLEPSTPLPPPPAQDGSQGDSRSNDGQT